MNWYRVADRGARLTMVVSVIVLVVMFCSGMYGLIMSGAFITIIGVLALIAASLLYIFWGSWKK